MMWDINKAFENSNQSAQERYEMLEWVLSGVNHMRSELLKECKFCSECKKHYFKKELRLDTRTVKKTICINPLTGGYLDPYEYEEKKVTEYAYLCPEGHHVTDYEEWLPKL